MCDIPFGNFYWAENDLLEHYSWLEAEATAAGADHGKSYINPIIALFNLKKVAFLFGFLHRFHVGCSISLTALIALSIYQAPGLLSLEIYLEHF